MRVSKESVNALEKSFDLEPKHPRLKPGLTEVPWSFDKAAGLSPKQIKDKLGSGWQIKTMSHNKETPIESLGSHKWLNQRCLEGKQALVKCLEKSFNLKLISATSLGRIATKNCTPLDLVVIQLLTNFQVKCLLGDRVNNYGSWA